MGVTWVRSLGWEDPLEEEMATHSNILAQKIPWTEDPGELWSIALQSQTRLKRLSTSVNSVGGHISRIHAVTCKGLFWLCQMQKDGDLGPT